MKSSSSKGDNIQSKNRHDDRAFLTGKANEVLNVNQIHFPHGQYMYNTAVEGI